MNGNPYFVVINAYQCHAVSHDGHNNFSARDAYLEALWGPLGPFGDPGTRLRDAKS